MTIGENHQFWKPLTDRTNWQREREMRHRAPSIPGCVMTPAIQHRYITVLILAGWLATYKGKYMQIMKGEECFFCFRNDLNILSDL